MIQTLIIPFVTMSTTSQVIAQSRFSQVKTSRAKIAQLLDILEKTIGSQKLALLDFYQRVVFPCRGEGMDSYENGLMGSIAKYDDKFPFPAWDDLVMENVTSAGASYIHSISTCAKFKSEICAHIADYYEACVSIPFEFIHQKIGGRTASKIGEEHLRSFADIVISLLPQAIPSASNTQARCHVNIGSVSVNIKLPAHIGSAISHPESFCVGDIAYEHWIPSLEVILDVAKTIHEIKLAHPNGTDPREFIKELQKNETIDILYELDEVTQDFYTIEYEWLSRFKEIFPELK